MRMGVQSRRQVAFSLQCTCSYILVRKYYVGLWICAKRRFAHRTCEMSRHVARFTISSTWSTHKRTSTCFCQIWMHVVIIDMGFDGRVMRTDAFTRWRSRYRIPFVQVFELCLPAAAVTKHFNLTDAYSLSQTWLLPVALPLIRSRMGYWLFPRTDEQSHGRLTLRPMPRRPW